MEKSNTTYRVKQDIVIPAGTELHSAPVKTQYFTPHVEAMIGPTKDTTFSWVMDLGDAIEAGLVEEVPESEAV